MSNANKNYTSTKKVKANTKKNDKNRIAFLLVSVVLFLVILVSTVFNDVMQIYNNKKETESLGTRYKELLEEEASLNSEVIKLQDPEYVARYAREKYLYTLDGEKILTIIDSNQKEVSSTEDSKSEG